MVFCWRTSSLGCRQKKSIAMSAGFHWGTQLARSGSDTPLSVWTIGNSSSKSDDPLFQILLPTSTCWWTLVALVPNSAFLSLIRGSIPTGSSILEFYDNVGLDVVDVLEFSPKLEVLWTTGDTSAWRLPWLQIVEYWHSYSPSDLIHTLRLAPPLTKLTIECEVTVKRLITLLTETPQLDDLGFGVNAQDVLVPSLQSLWFVEPTHATSRDRYPQKRITYGAEDWNGITDPAEQIVGQSLMSVTLEVKLDFEEQELQEPRD
ncbi:hypothetical protein C8J56DRAFT_1165795 [Mycena floridula]|nr:hypothetical protein C8J56DRAFT_1165795 [Mycena floridula]